MADEQQKSQETIDSERIEWMRRVIIDRNAGVVGTGYALELAHDDFACAALRTIDRLEAEKQALLYQLRVIGAAVKDAPHKLEAASRAIDRWDYKRGKLLEGDWQS